MKSVQIRKYEVFSGPYFPVFGLSRGLSTGKEKPEKISYLDTFQAVQVSTKWLSSFWNSSGKCCNVFNVSLIFLWTLDGIKSLFVKIHIHLVAEKLCAGILFYSLTELIYLQMGCGIGTLNVAFSGLSRFSKSLTLNFDKRKSVNPANVPVLLYRWTYTRRGIKLEVNENTNALTKVDT